MLNGVIGVKDIKAGYFVGYSMTKFDNFEVIKNMYERDFKILPKEEIEKFKDKEFYFLGCFDDLEGKFLPVDKKFILGVNDYVHD